MIDRETIDRIYAAANIVDIVGEYVTLKRQGVNYQACCPFHQEKTPSFVVSPARGIYKCFGCGKGGNAVNFIMEYENVTYPEALKMVAKRYGIEVREKEMSDEDVQRNNNRESMFAVNTWASDYFAGHLHNSEEGRSVGLRYLSQSRGFTDATIRKFGLGFCPSNGDAMSRAAREAGYKEEFLLSTGLSIKSERDGSLFDRFRDRVMFPVHNVSGRVVAFGGRTLRTDKKVAKYQNSPESEIYSKSRELYGLYFAKKAIQREDFAIMVEGYADVISMHQAGVENVVASSGTSLTTDQIRLLGRFTKNITVMYDGDAAGVHAAIRGVDMILREDMNVRIVLLPPEHDPDTFARANTTDYLRSYVRDNAEDFISFKAKLLLREATDDPVKRSQAIGDMVQSIAIIGDAIKRAVYIKDCAKIMNIDESVLVAEVARMRIASTGDREAEEFIRRQRMQRQEENRAAVQPEEDLSARSMRAGSSIGALERELAKYLIKYGHRYFEFREGRETVSLNVAAEILRDLDSDGLHFDDKTLDSILTVYREQHEALGEGVEVPSHRFVNHPDPEVCNAAVDILTADDNYVPSQLWKRKDIHVESEEEMLSHGVPKAIALYKSKIIERLIAEQQALLTDEELPEDKQSEIMARLNRYNKAKVQIAKKLQRLIL